MNSGDCDWFPFHFKDKFLSLVRSNYTQNRSIAIVLLDNYGGIIIITIYFFFVHLSGNYLYDNEVPYSMNISDSFILSNTWV
jgi:hypothetical protein